MNSLIESGMMVSKGKKTLIVDLAFIGSSGSAEYYLIPAELSDRFEFFINICESGCRGEATTICHVDGSLLKPFKIFRNTGTAFFSRMNLVSANVVKSDDSYSILLLKHTINIEKNNVIYTETVLFTGKYVNFKGTESLLKYNDVVEAAIKRCDMRFYPENPCYAL